MEQIKQTIEEQNVLTRTSLPNPPSSIANGKNRNQTISPIEHAALFAIINKSRMLNGWSTRTAQELDATIRTWGEIFARYGIPASAYSELYQRAFDVRQTRMRTSQDAPQMDATLLVSQWTGDWGLKAELRQREIDRGRTLSANAESICVKCHGTGFEEVKDTDGRHLGVRPGCTH